jgi:hypothetical protein
MDGKTFLVPVMLPPTARPAAARACGIVVSFSQLLNIYVIISSIYVESLSRQ